MKVEPSSSRRYEDARRRLSMNQATVPRWSSTELIEGCARAGYAGVGLWRHRLEGEDPARLAKRAAGAGVEISSLCRGGFFLAPEPAERRVRATDNRRAVDEAAVLGARTLVLVCGPATDRHLGAGRRAVADAVCELAAYAGPAGVLLAIEAMHPLYCADRSIVVTLAQAVGLAEAAEAATGSRVGVVLDSYHLWWDPDLAGSMASASGRVYSVQLADWVVPLSDPLNGRGMVGDGSIDFLSFRHLVEGTGYSGLDEVEIFNPEVWDADPCEVLEVAAGRYAEHVLGSTVGS